MLLLFCRPRVVISAFVIALTVIMASITNAPVNASTSESAGQLQAASAPGHYRTVTFDYNRPEVQVPQIHKTSPLRGHVVAPVGAQGPRPVVLLLHGFFETCADKNREPVFASPCPPGTKEVENYKGYDYVQHTLAALGFVTVSVDANAVNSNDQDLLDKGAGARSVVVRAHLSLLAQGPSALGPKVPATLPHFDMNRVMLVGHSRGGEGVNRAAADSTARDPWRIAAIASVAPTNFERISNPTIPSATFLPTCDGDVIDLAGQAYTDAAATYGNGSALHTTFMVTGGVHNLFNTEWSPGAPTAKGANDGERASCPASSRISAQAHHDVLNTYLSLTARAFLNQDPTALAVLDGTSQAHGKGSELVHTVPVGGNREFVMNAMMATSRKDVAAYQTRGAATWCEPAKCRSIALREAAPHWLDNDSRDGLALLMNLHKGASGQVMFAPHQLHRGDSIDARIVVRSKAGAHVRAQLLDPAGHPIALKTDPHIHLARLGSEDAHTPTTQGSGVRDLAQYWRMSIPDDVFARGGDRIRDNGRAPSNPGTLSIGGLRFTGLSKDSSIAILDISVAHTFAAPYSPSPNPPGTTATLPDASISAPQPITVSEGSSPHTMYVPVKIRGALHKPASIGIAVPDPGTPNATITTSHVDWVPVKPGQRSVNLPVTINGNTIDSDDVLPIQYQLETRGPLTVVNPLGTVNVKDDDPDPTFTITPVHNKVQPGKTLEWRITMHGATNRTFMSVTAGPTPAGKNELTVAHIASQTRKAFGVDASGTGSATKNRKFSEVGSSIDLHFSKPDSHGTSSATIQVTTTPGAYSGKVALKLEFVGINGPGTTLTGTVSRT